MIETFRGALSDSGQPVVVSKDLERTWNRKSFKAMMAAESNQIHNPCVVKTRLAYKLALKKLIAKKKN